MSDNLRPLSRPLFECLIGKLVVVDEVGFRPSDIVQMIRREDLLDQFSEPELLDMIRSLRAEVKFRRATRIHLATNPN